MRPRYTLLVDGAAAALVVLLGLVLSRSSGSITAVTGRQLVVLLLAALGVLLARRAPGAALATVWVAGAADLVLVADAMVVPLVVAVFVVAYTCARHGSRTVVVTAGASVPVGVLVAFVAVAVAPDRVRIAQFASPVRDVTGAGVVGAALATTAALAAPYVLGLLLRLEQRHRRDEQEHRVEHAHAVELAESRAAQTRLTREVHDVVGHSLAVIVAQADAAGAAAGGADPAVHDALVRIAEIGRASLGEVRDVLSRTGDPADGPEAQAPDIETLVDGVRAAGHEVMRTSDGTGRVLPVDTATALYRVVQELLTNALKHGGPGPIELRDEWTPSGLVVRVSNPARPAAGPAVPGSGLDGIRWRLDAVGGELHTDRLDGRFTATARLPVPAGR